MRSEGLVRLWAWLGIAANPTYLYLITNRRCRVFARIVISAVNQLDELRVAHLNLRAECSNCGHAGIVDGAKLWRWFALHRWDSSLDAVPRHMRCQVCGRRPTALHPTIEAPTIDFGPATEAQWKKAVERLTR